MRKATKSTGWWNVVSTTCNPRVAAVRSLLLECGPLAILGRVVAVTILTVERKPFRPFPHVRKEVQERTALSRVPSVTDGDSSAAVSRVGSVSRISASPEHRHPTLIGGCPRHAVRDDAGDIGLPGSLLTDDGLGLFRVANAEPGIVVAADEPPHRSMADGSHLTAAARAGHWLSVRPLVVSCNEALAMLVAKIRAPRNPLAAAARAQRRFQAMSSQEVRSFVTEQVFSGNFLATPTLALHRPIVARV